MRVLVDTSAWYALSDEDDAHHKAASGVYHSLLTQPADLWVTSYVVHEAAALMPARLGLAALAKFRTSIIAATSIAWITPAMHEAAWDELERISRRGISLTDCSSAVVARELGIHRVFAYDPHFAIWGLEVLT